MSRQALARIDGPPLERLDELIWIAEIPALGAREVPEREAIVFADRARRTSFAQLEAQSNAFAAALHRKGAQSGDRIAYLGRNNDLFFPVLFGAIRADVVLVPLNWRLAPPEIRYQLQDSGARWVICDPDFRAAATQAMAGLPANPELWLTETATSSATSSVANSAENSDCVEAALRQNAKVLPAPKIHDQVILQLYTSGTTGKPKGVLITHGALSLARHTERVSPDWIDWQTGEVSLSAMPNFHIGGLSWVLIGLVRFATVVITADATPDSLLRLMRDYHVERTFVVPTVLRAMLDELRRRGEPPPRPRGIYYGAMPIGESLLRDILATFDCRLGQFFGMTEITGVATFLPPSAHTLDRLERLSSVGKPIAGMRLEIRGPDRRTLNTGERGEIWIEAPTRMLGYWNLPEQTAAALVDGWYATGDGGYLDEDGYLYLTDRIKDLIVSGGENIYPGEVEEALRQHPQVLDAAVVGLPDVRWGESVVAVVELKPGSTATEEDLRRHARGRIASYKCPKSIRFGALPRTASGKVQRAIIRQQLTALRKDQ